MTLTKNAQHTPWMLSLPRDVDPSLDADAHDIIAAAHLLVAFLSARVALPAFDTITGPAEPVAVLVDAWVMHMTAKGVRVSAPPPSFTARGCYASRATLPQSSPPLSSADPTIALASPSRTTAADIAALVPLYVAFSRHSPHPIEPDTAQLVLCEAVAARKVWLCYSHSDMDNEGSGDGRGDARVLAGFSMLGRTTPRTIAIRHVFVRPEYRRRGLAEAMVRTVTRYYLGVGGDSACEDAETDGLRVAAASEVKRQVCLNVADPAVERIYRRCGFLADEDALDAETGARACYVSVLRCVQLLPP